MQLESLDLNLLLIFDALVTERNVTRAARKVGLSQPAMSSALARARLVFGDQLFKRVHGQMEPTPRARQLLAPIGEAVAKLRAALESQPAFRPETSEHEFQIATNEYVEVLVLGPLLHKLRKCASAITLHTVRTNYLFLSPIDQLQSSEIDLAIGFFSKTPKPQSGLFAMPLFEDRLVCVLRESHPRAQRKLDLRTFLKTPQIRTLYPDDVRLSTIDFVLQSRGLARRVALTVPHMLTALAIASRSDLLVVAPERLARREARRQRLRIFDPPVPLPNLSLVMVWHERKQFDPAHVWLRNLIARVAE